MTLRFKGFVLNIEAGVRYETEEVNPLIKKAYVAEEVLLDYRDLRLAMNRDDA